MSNVQCALQMAVEIDALESGAQSYPIFYYDNQCGTSQYPPEGEPLQQSLIGAGGFNFREAACQYIPSAYDPSQPSTSTPFPAYINNEVIAGPIPLPISLCPLPGIQSAIIPDAFSVSFYSIGVPQGSYTPDPFITSTVASAGTYTIKTGDPLLSSNNVWTLNTNTNSPAQWLDASGNTCPDTAPGWNSNGLMNYSIISCGTPFWPSLASTFPDYETSNNNTQWRTLNRTRAPQNSETYTFCRAGSQGNNATPGASTINTAGLFSTEEYLACPSNDKAVSLSYGDCLLTVIGENNLPSQDANLCFCFNQAPGGTQPVCNTGGTCGCQAFQAIQGSVMWAAIEYTGQDWETLQFLYCTGQQTLSLGGIPVQRYGNGTVACDDIVTSFCTNTAFVASDPNYLKACSCILEQQRVNLQFAGLNLPVQCFSSICNDNDPTVYHTSQQAKGCEARICEQIISINGSYIYAEGYQSITCDGQEYSVQNVVQPTMSVPLITATAPKLGIKLDTTFFIALGALGVVIILIVVWAIRKVVLQKRAQALKKKKVTAAIENLIESNQTAPVK